MQAIYKEDGTITKVYDETLHRHDSLLTVNLTDEEKKRGQVPLLMINRRRPYLLVRLGETGPAIFANSPQLAPPMNK